MKNIKSNIQLPFFRVEHYAMYPVEITVWSRLITEYYDDYEVMVLNAPRTPN